jgi:hypothetical protein
MSRGTINAWITQIRLIVDGRVLCGDTPRKLLEWYRYLNRSTLGTLAERGLVPLWFERKKFLILDPGEYWTVVVQTSGAVPIGTHGDSGQSDESPSGS